MTVSHLLSVCCIAWVQLLLWPAATAVAQVTPQALSDPPAAAQPIAQETTPAAAVAPPQAVETQLAVPPYPPSPADRGQVRAKTGDTPLDSLQRNRRGLGLAGSFATGSGLAYRHYWGQTALQLVLLGYARTQDLADGTRQLDSALFWAGGSVIHYVKIWHDPVQRGLLPTTTGLRVLGGAHYYLQQQQQSVGAVTNGLFTATTTSRRASSVNLGAGIGFEFGGLVQSGFSLALDLVLTMAVDGNGIDYILPLPQGAVLYNW
jgi:hypothetical protein